MKYCAILMIGFCGVLLGYDMKIPLSKSDAQFWQSQAERLPWFSRWNCILDMHGTCAHWFVDGHINASYACLDIHIEQGYGDKPALFWTNERGDSETVTYTQLYTDVNNLAAFLRDLGVAYADRVVIYMPMIPQALVAMLACARIGAIHIVVFSGFSTQALKDRIIDAQAMCVITSDVAYYRGKELHLKENVYQACADMSQQPTVLVVPRTHDATHCRYVEPVAVESQHPLFILYTSGTTGKPKGIIHATGGYLTYVYSTIKQAFGITRDSVYWCTADVGWITGHSYGVYGPLMHGATLVMREGAPDWPDASAWWKVIDMYKASIFYTSPTALRMFMRVGPDVFAGAHLTSLRVLGSVGEPINPEVWRWYYQHIGNNRCPIIDTWWQTETGGFMIAPTVSMNHAELKPGSASYPLQKISAVIVDSQGNEVPRGTKGFLVIQKPWPGMALGIYNNPTLFNDVYWSRFPGMYYTGDYAIQDVDGCFWLLGRADEIIKVSGHRIGTAELESVILEHNAVAENAAIGLQDPIKGEAIVIFVVLKKGYEFTQELRDTLIHCIRMNIGSFATPRAIYCVDKLPKTRSGKIMRRLLKAILEGHEIGDTSTLEDGLSLQELDALVHITQQSLRNIELF